MIKRDSITIFKFKKIKKVFLSLLRLPLQQCKERFSCSNTLSWSLRLSEHVKNFAKRPKRSLKAGLRWFLRLFLPPFLIKAVSARNFFIPLQKRSGISSSFQKQASILSEWRSPIDFPSFRFSPSLKITPAANNRKFVRKKNKYKIS